MILAFGISGTLLHVADGRPGFGTFVGAITVVALACGCACWCDLLYTGRRRRS